MSLTFTPTVPRGARTLVKFRATFLALAKLHETVEILRLTSQRDKGYDGQYFKQLVSQF